jgi:hypothetical protein
MNHSLHHLRPSLRLLLPLAILLAAAALSLLPTSELAPRVEAARPMSALALAPATCLDCSQGYWLLRRCHTLQIRGATHQELRQHGCPSARRSTPEARPLDRNGTHAPVLAGKGAGRLEAGAPRASQSLNTRGLVELADHLRSNPTASAPGRAPTILRRLNKGHIHVPGPAPDARIQQSI